MKAPTVHVQARSLLCGAALAAAGALSAALVTAAPAGTAKTGKEPAAMADVQDLVFLGEARPVFVRLHVQIDGKPLQTAHADFLKYLFNYLDVNGDGVLSKQEAERAPSLDLIAGGLLGQAGRGGRGASSGSGPTMADLDTDKDGKVTRAELAAYYHKNGLRPLQLQIDSGQDGLPGGLAYLGGPRSEPPVTAVSEALFKLLDANQDGKLSQQELAAAPTVLLRLDEDEDEVVTTHELVPNAPQPGLGLGRGRGRMGMMGAPATNNSNNKTLILLDTPGKAPADLGQRLRERYGARAGAGKTLTRKDMGLDEATFALLDRNRDGVLDEAELAGFAGRGPDLEVVVRTGGWISGVDLDPRGAKAALAARAAKKTDAVCLDMGLTRAELRPVSKGAGFPFAGIVRSQIVAQLRTADVDGNGYVDEKEASGNRAIRGLFKVADRNGDGKLTEKELTAYLEAVDEMEKQAALGCVTLVLRNQSRGLFDLLDTNRDHQLGVREMRQAPKLLISLGCEDRGYLTREDVPRTYEMGIRPGMVERGPNPGAIFARLYGGGTTYEPAKKGVGPAWFRKMDRNRDGDVSRKEFLFSDELFRKLDTDGDGLISVAEAEKAK